MLKFQIPHLNIKNLIAALLVPCLIIDPVLAVSLKTSVVPQGGGGRGQIDSPFNQQALAAEAFDQLRYRDQAGGGIRGNVVRLLVLSVMGAMAQVPPAQPPSGNSGSPQAGLPGSTGSRPVLTRRTVDAALKGIRKSRHDVDRARQTLVSDLDALIKRSGNSAADRNLKQNHRRVLFLARERFIGRRDVSADLFSHLAVLLNARAQLNTDMDTLNALLDASNVLDARQTGQLLGDDLTFFITQARQELLDVDKSQVETSFLLFFTISPASNKNFYAPQGMNLISTEFLGIDPKGGYVFGELISRPAGQPQIPNDRRFVVVTAEGLHQQLPAGSDLPPLSPIANRLAAQNSSSALVLPIWRHLLAGIMVGFDFLSGRSVAHRFRAEPRRIHDQFQDSAA